MNSLNGGYAMIKYNSTQEELQIAYRSKKPVLCYDENRRAHWAVIEETATESVDEETQEPITIYEYSYRLIDEASGGGATLDDIVDSQDRKRFIEGDLTLLLSPEQMEQYGATVLYSKWSLSGTHLMIVACVSFSKATQQSDLITIFKVNLPDWIKEKLVPIFSTHLISRVLVAKYPTGNLSASLYTYNNEVTLNLSNLMDNPITANCTARYQFDLLIDTE